MSLLDSQQETILRIYAEATEYSPYPEHRDDKILELWSNFSCDIPDWLKRFRLILEERRFASALETLDHLVSTEKYINEPTAFPSARVVRAAWAPYYRPISEVKEDMRILETRRFNYTLTMVYMDTMYRNGLLDDDDYEKCHDAIGEKYGFDRDSLFRWNGPPKEKKEAKPPEEKRRKNKTYTKRNKEYWAKFNHQDEE